MGARSEEAAISRFGRVRRCAAEHQRGEKPHLNSSYTDHVFSSADSQVDWRARSRPRLARSARSASSEASLARASPMSRGSDENRRVARDLRHRGTVRGKHRNAVSHGLQNRHAEAFIEGREGENRCAAVKRLKLFPCDIAENVDPGARGAFLHGAQLFGRAESIRGLRRPAPDARTWAEARRLSPARQCSSFAGWRRRTIRGFRAGRTFQPYARRDGLLERALFPRREDVPPGTR